MDLPKDWPGPNGRTLAVVKAIVKQERGSGQWIVRCGKAGKGCRGIIGYPTSYLENVALPESTIDLMGKRADRPISQPPADVWCLTHPHCYFGDKRSGFHVRDTPGPSRSSRTPLHSMIAAKYASSEAPHPPQAVLAQSSRPVLGQFPTPPCIVFCPTCETPNHVDPPDAEPPLPMPAEA